MSAVDDLLDRAKAASGLPSDYSITRRLHKAASWVYELRAGRRLPTQEATIALAELAGEDPLVWVHFWMRAAERISA
jgi:hypothetical protein